MSKSMLLVPVQEDELSQPLYVEGVAISVMYH